MYKGICIILLALLSCSEHPERDISCEVSNIAINPHVLSEQLKIDQYKIDKIIDLKLPEDKFITQVDKMMLFENKIYILDKEYGKTIYVFDSLGNYLHNIGEIGRSKPELYRQPSDFSINKKNGDVYVFEKESKKIILFDKNGKYKDVIEFKRYWPYAFALLENNNFAFAFRMKNNFLTDDYELVISDTSEIPISNYRKLTNNYLLTSEIPFSISGDQLFFIPNLCDTIYAIKNDTIIRRIAVDFGASKMSEDNRNELKSTGDYLIAKNLQCVRSVDRYFENDYWINIEYDYSSLKLNYLKNKNAGTEYNYVTLFQGLMPNNLVYIKNETLLFMITENDVNQWLGIKDQDKSVWNELYDNSNDVIKDVINQNKQNCMLLYVTLK